RAGRLRGPATQWGAGFGSPSLVSCQTNLRSHLIHQGGVVDGTCLMGAMGWYRGGPALAPGGAHLFPRHSARISWERSEERRVGKECRYLWATCSYKRNKTAS